MTQHTRTDSYFTRVEQLLRDHVTIREDLQQRLQRLREDLTDVPSAVCLRGYPTDMEIIPGHKDPERRILSDIDRIGHETEQCKGEIRRVLSELYELDRLMDCVNRLPGKPGQVLRWLYVDGQTWEEVEGQGIDRKSISRYRKIGIEKLANRIYSKVRY